MKSVLAVAAVAAAVASASPSSASREAVHMPLRRRAPTGGLERHAKAAAFARTRYGYVHPGTKAKRAGNVGSLSIIDQSQDSSYLGIVGIGSPAQNFELVLDTGSSDLWVVGSSCKGCSSASPFDSSKSSSFKADTSGQKVTISYGSGAVRGTLAEDAVSFAGFSASQQVFLLATQTSDNLLTGDNTGIIGLAFESIASTQAIPLWQALQQGGNLAQPYLSFFLERLKDDTSAPADNAFGGVFTLGGTNQTFYTGDIDFQPFPSGTQQSFWLQTVKAVTVNGNSVSLAGGDAELAAIDTGTTLIGGPSSDVAAVWKQVQGSAAVTSGDYVGFYSFPCTTQVTVTFNFGGKTWPISTDDMNIGATTDDPSKCLGAIFDLGQGTSIQGGGGNPSWVVGDTFLKNVYAVFDAGSGSSNARVGFATLASGAQSTASATPISPSGVSTVGGGGGGQSTGSGIIPGSTLGQQTGTASNPFGNTNPTVSFSGPAGSSTGSGSSSGSGTSSGAGVPAASLFVMAGAALAGALVVML